MSVQTKQEAVRRVRTDTRTTERYEGHLLDFIALLTSEKRTGKVVISLNQGQAYNLEFEKVEKKSQ